MPRPVKVKSTKHFDIVLSQCKTVFAEFYVSWSPVSTIFKPVFARHSENHDKPWETAFVRVHCERLPEIAYKHEIDSYPTYIVFVQGEPCGRCESNSVELAALVEKYTAPQASPEPDNNDTAEPDSTSAPGDKSSDIEETSVKATERRPPSKPVGKKGPESLAEPAKSSETLKDAHDSSKHGSSAPSEKKELRVHHHHAVRHVNATHRPRRRHRSHRRHYQSNHPYNYYDPANSEPQNSDDHDNTQAEHEAEEIPQTNTQPQQSEAKQTVSTAEKSNTSFADTQLDESGPIAVERATDVDSDILTCPSSPTETELHYYQGF